MTRLNASNSKKSRGNSNSQEFFASQNMRLFSKNVRLLFAAIFRGLQTTSAVLCLDAHTKKRSLSAPFYMCLKQMVILGDMSLGGSIKPVENLAGCMQLAFDCGAKRVLLPMASVSDIPTIPGELFAKFQTSFYSDPVDAVFKALGVD